MTSVYNNQAIPQARARTHARTHALAHVNTYTPQTHTYLSTRLSPHWQLSARVRLDVILQDDENDPDAVIGYEAGEEINADELPPALRVRCHGRRVVALRRVNAKISAENEDERGLQRGKHLSSSLSLSVSPPLSFRLLPLCVLSFARYQSY